MKNKIELFDDYAKCYITDKCFFLLDLDDVEMAGENNQNRSNTNNPLGVKGVYLNEWGTYRAQITINRKYIYLGTFQTLKEACDAYDKAAQEYFGEFAVLNNYVA